MKLLKKKAKRFLSLMLAVLLTWTLIPASALTVWADGESGSFVLMALSGGQPIIPPTTIHYNPGSSVKDALLASGYTFAGLEDGGWINAVEGVSDSYILYYDNAGYDLTVSADQISAIWITGNYEQAYSDALLSLEKDLAVYREAGDGRTQYAPLAEAANAALSGYWSADADTAAALDAELLSKTEEYLELIHGDTAPVILQITRGGTPVTAATCTFTNAYGTESVMDLPADGRVSLVPGTYSFDISDGLFSHVKGNLTVEAGTENVLSAELPSGQWITDVDLGLATDWSEPVTKTGTFGSDAVYYLPDYAGTKLFIYAANAADVDPASVRLYFGNDREMQSGAKVWNSHTTYVNNAVVANSLTPGYARVEARKAMADGTTQTQEYRISFVRVPTLSGLTVKAKGTKLPLEFNPDTLEYTLSTVENQVDLTATLLCDNATLTVNGSAVESGSPTTVTLQNKGVTTVTVTAAADGVERSYVLKIEKKESAEVTLNHAAGMTTCIKNAAGEEILPATESAAADTYHLTPGETYTWIGTKDTWYHTSGSFTASAGLKVNAATPVTTDWITSMNIKSATGTAAVMYPIVPDFAPSEHELDFQIGTSRTFCYMTANVAASDLTIHLSYNSYKGDPIERDHTVGKATNIPTLINQNGNTNRLAITVAKTDSTGVTYYQDYKVRVRRLMEANSIKVSDPDGNELVLTQDIAAAKTGYDKTVLNYTAGVAKKTQTLNIDTQLYSSLVGNDFNGVITVASPEGSSEIRFDEEHAPNVAQTTSIALDPKKAAEDITITIGHTDPEAIEQVYTIHITKLDPVMTRFNITPADATLFLTEDLSGVRILPEEDGSYALCETLTYNYVITAKGYVATSGSFTSDKNVTSYNYNLVKAEETSYKDISGDDDWSSFRQGTENNGITDSKTPIKAEDAVLVWANKIGDGYGSGATGCPILVGGYLYTYAGTSIVKVDKETGEVVQSGDMVASSSFAINSPTYANGLIFVGLSNGRIQAFNAETLESVWLYTDPLGGQPNSTIAYKDGYIYTGFWNSETKKANFVCISVTDEDPAQTTEAKLATWRHTDNGFYWAGAYVTDAYTLVTTDDGDSGSSSGHGSVISFDPVTGAILDKFEAPVVGDLRSSICYDAATDACYFTSKGGYFCSIRMNADGTFREDSFRSIKLSNGSENSVAMSTSTPTVYKGRAYVGASGTGQFTQYSGHNITVIDLASWSIAYTVPTQGYPQTSGLLTTAYENDTEYVYVYFLDNFTPGKLRVLRDKAGQTALDLAYSTHESYTEKNVTYDFDTAYVLFTPSGKQAQYAICSPIVDADGNIYFKNDSAQLMKLSSMITSLEVTQDPSIAVYCKGQTFDPAGMKVTARYSNGTTKDISAYVSCYLDSEWTEDVESHPLEEGISSIHVTFDYSKMQKGETGYWTLYHNENGEAGCEIPSIPDTTVAVSVEGKHVDANKDGICDRCGEVTNQPAVIITQPESVTAGIKASVTYHVEAEHAVSYQWFYTKDGVKWYTSSSDTAKTDTLSFTVATANANNKYKCKIIGEDGNAVFTDIVAINLIPGVVIKEQPVSVSSEITKTESFHVTAENVQKYQWYYSKDGINWFKSSNDGNTTDTLSVRFIAANQNNVYRCKMTGTDGNDKFSSTVGAVIITQQPTNCNAPNGQTATYSVKASDIAFYQWQYSKNDGVTWFNSTYESAVTDTLSFKAASTNRSTIYRCKLTKTNGIVGYSNSVGFVEGLSIISQPQNVEAAKGESISFTVEAKNVTADGYQWYYSKDGKSWFKSSITGSKTATLTMNASQDASTKVYRCKLTGTDGSTMFTDTVKLTLK